MTDDILKQLKAGEVSGVQFKERILDKYDIACELVAFSNSHGGKLVVGIKDKTGETNALSYSEVQETTNLLFVITVLRGESNQVSNEVHKKSNQVGNEVQGKSNQVENLDTRLRHSDTDLDTGLRHSGTNLDTGLRHSGTNLDTKRVTLTNKEKDIVNFCSVPRTTKEILDRIGVSMHSKNRERYITSLVAAGYLQMTNPDNPTASNQKYKKANTR